MQRRAIQMRILPEKGEGRQSVKDEAFGRSGPLRPLYGQLTMVFMATVVGRL